MADLMVKSTPLGALKCPRVAIAPEETHTVTADGGTRYTCSCGETFLWEDQTHYEKASPDE